jgi:hypothetical protein
MKLQLQLTSAQAEALRRQGVGVLLSAGEHGRVEVAAWRRLLAALHEAESGARAARGQR